MTREENQIGLRMLVRGIQEHEDHIRWCEDAMRAGVGPWDMEESRLELSRLRKVKAWLESIDNPENPLPMPEWMEQRCRDAFLKGEREA